MLRDFLNRWSFAFRPSVPIRGKNLFRCFPLLVIELLLRETIQIIIRIEWRMQMRLRNIHIKNFRALEEINVDFESPVNVIVGPNAISKTTILEAIRLVKATVAPRSQSETAQALFALGASLPYNPQRLIPTALARDQQTEVEIRCRYHLNAKELEAVTGSVHE
jgi:hypothetical protein